MQDQAHMAVTAPEAVESVEDLLRLMVRHDTVNSAFSRRPAPEAALSEALERLACAWGFATRRLPVPGHCHNLLILHEVNPDRPWLMFDSHLDTVDIQHMTIDPLGGQVRQGRLWGRGACDTKGTGAAMLWALRRYAQSSDQPQNIALLLSVDEEHGMAGIRRFFQHDYPRLGFQARGLIVGEPTELHPVIAHNGLVRWKVITHGKSAHSSVPHEGRSAIAMMMRAMAALESQYIAKLQAQHPLTGQAVCSVNVIAGGTAVNVIPARCQVEIDRRLIPGEDPESVMPAAAAVLESLRRDDPAFHFEQELMVQHPPLSDQRNGTFLATVKAALADLGLPTLHLGAPFCTHAGYADEAGLPAIVLGPGSAAPAHQASEWIDLDQLHRGVELYE
ncbi:MAG TPA: M20/M25/M40 family metallo-hydrolase, partial [Phycisphaeraceae bacterium]